MAEISLPSGKPLFFRLNYDGVFEEEEKGTVLTSTPIMAERMEAFLNTVGDTSATSFSEALRTSLRTWAISQLETDLEAEKQAGAVPTPEALDPLLKRSLESHTIEVALLDRTEPGSSKYRTPSRDEIEQALKGWLK